MPSPEQIAGVVVTGSVSMVSAREDWSEPSAAWLAGVVADDAVPVLGLCYGHQLIAHALGGVVGLQPILIVLMGIMVFILALGVFLPMWDLVLVARKS